MMKLKKLISTVLATVMAASVLSVGMVCSTSAAATTHYFMDGKEADSYFTDGSAGATTTGIVSDTTFTFSDEETTNKPAKAYKMSKTSTITFTVDGTATVDIVWASRYDKTQTATIVLTGGTLDADVESSSISTQNVSTEMVHLTKDNLGAGTYTIRDKDTANGKEFHIYGIKVVDTLSDNAKTYTISGTSNLTSGDTFELVKEDTAYTASVSDGGAWTVEKSAETAPFATGDTLTVKKGQYTADPGTITLGEGDTTFTAGNITFTKIELADLDAAAPYNAAQIEEGRPNFDIDELTIEGTGKYKGTLRFKLSQSAKVTINAKCGSKDDGKYVDITLGTLTQHVDKSVSEYTDFVAYVPAGLATLSIASTGTTLQVNNITIEYIEGVADNVSKVTVATNDGTNDSFAPTTDGQDTYIFHPIKKEALNAGDTLTLTTTGDKHISTDKVYKMVQLPDNTIVSADQIGGDYIYAIQVQSTNGAQPTGTLTWNIAPKE